MQQTFAHLSDPHLTTLDGVSPRQLPNKRILGYLSWRRKRRYEHRPEVLQALVEHLRQSSCEQTVITGDLTHIGMPEEFRQATQWLHALGDPASIALVPGNHECYVQQDWDAGFALWQSYLEGDDGAPPIYPSLRVRGRLAFIGLSSACPTAPFMASGTLGGEQLERLDRLLEDTRQRGLFRIVYLHHSPMPGVEKWRKRLTDAKPLSELLGRSGAELVLHGHGHRVRHYWLPSEQGEIPVMAVPSASALGLHGADTARYNQYRISSMDPESGWKLTVSAYGYDGTEQLVRLFDKQELSVPRKHAAQD